VIDLLKHRLPNLKFTTTEALNIHPDAKEAVLFALLANETLSGSVVNFGNHPAIPSVCMGKISLPG
jgi:anhydro-N-acetylmuramic acid kinase